MMTEAKAIRICAFVCVSMALLSSSLSSGAQIPTAYAAVTDFQPVQMYLGECVLAVGHEGGISMIDGCACRVDVRKVRAGDRW
jgi:hypothetical protein